MSTVFFSGKVYYRFRWNTEPAERCSIRRTSGEQRLSVSRWSTVWTRLSVSISPSCPALIYLSMLFSPGLPQMKGQSRTSWPPRCVPVHPFVHGEDLAGFLPPLQTDLLLLAQASFYFQHPSFVTFFWVLRFLIGHKIWKWFSLRALWPLRVYHVKTLLSDTLFQKGRVFDESITWK